MIFWEINIVVGILFLIILFIACVEVIKKIKLNYPNIKFTKQSIGRSIINTLQLLLCAFCPILNIVAAFALLSNFDVVCEKAYLDCLPLLNKEQEEINNKLEL